MGSSLAIKHPFRDLQNSLDPGIALTAQAFFNSTPTSGSKTEHFGSTLSLLLGLLQPSEKLKERMWTLVNRWYDEWRKRDEVGQIESEERMRVEVFFDLLQALSDPETIEDVSIAVPTRLLCNFRVS
jgi:hypothetical protein